MTGRGKTCIMKAIGRYGAPLAPDSNHFGIKQEEKKNANETEPLSPDGVASGRADAVFVAGKVLQCHSIVLRNSGQGLDLTIWIYLLTRLMIC